MAGPAGQPRDLGRRQAAFEMEVAVGEGSGDPEAFSIHNCRVSIHNSQIMRRARILALFLDVLVCAVPATWRA